MGGSEPALPHSGGPGDTGGADMCAAHRQTDLETYERGMPNRFVVWA